MARPPASPGMRALWRVALILGLAQLGFATILPLLPLYLTEQLNASVKLVGAVIAAFALVETLLKTAWGGVADRRGRRPIIVTGLALSALAPLVMAVLRAPLLFVPLRLVDGAGSAALWPASAAVVADTTEPHERATAMAMLNTAFLLGSAAGPALGLFVAGWLHDVRAGFYLASALLATAMVLALILFPKARRAGAGDGGAGAAAVHAPHLGHLIAAMRTSPLLLTLYLVAFVQMFGAGFLVPIAAIYAKRVLGLSEQSIGMIFLVVVIAVAVVGVPAARLADRVGKPPLIIAGMLLGTAGMWLVPFGGGVAALLAAGALLGASYALVLPSWLALITELAPPGQLGLAVGASETVQGMGIVLGPLLGGLLWDLWGPTAPFVGSAIALTAGTVLAVVVMRRR